MQSSIINHVAKGFYFFEKGYYFLTIRDSYLLTIRDSYLLTIYVCKGFWLFNQSWSLLIKYCASSTHQALKQRETKVDPVNKQIPARCGEGGRGGTFINRGWGLSNKAK